MFSKLKRFLKQYRLLVKIKRFVLRQRDDIDDFLFEYFNSSQNKMIVQVGANDGEMCDPLRPFLLLPGNYEASLVEPIPYYVEKLKSLYINRNDINIINAALGSDHKVVSLYFIPPSVADMMNGDGPKNNWAHGQGSFDKSTVIHWIEQNSFRGDEYRRQLNFFKESITSIEVPVIKTSNIIPDSNNLLLVIDVQGFELEVLNGVDWSKPPKYIMLEDDLGNTDKVFDFLKGKGYRYFAGNLDKVFIHQSFDI